MKKKRGNPKPPHPGTILEEFYIKYLNLNLEELADTLGLSRNTLFKIRKGRARISPTIAIRFAQAFNTTPDFWLNLQQKYDLWEAVKYSPCLNIPQIYPLQKKTSKSYRARC